MIKYLRIILFATLGVSAAFFTVSCDKDMSISLDNDNLDNLIVTSEDSIAAEVSTVQMPNIPTSGSGVVLVGKFTQAPVGSLESSSYFRLNPAGISNDIPSDATFDSLNLVIRQSSKMLNYGDTSKVQTITAHRLTQSLERKTIDNSITGRPLPFYITGAAIFGNQKFNYSTAALGSVSFVPKKNRMDSLSIKLDNALGNEFFTRIKTNHFSFTSASNFEEYFKGISLVPGATNTAMLAFSDTLQVRVNYSYKGTDGFKKKGIKVLSLSEKSLQFNNIVNNVSGTIFDGLSATKPLSSKNTNGIAYIQGGSGVATEIKFPGLREFLQQEGLAVNQAELEIELESKHVGAFPAAPNPILMISNSGIPRSYVMTPFSNQPQTGIYILGDNTGKKGRYRFNLIEHVKTVLNSESNEQSLFLSLPPALLQSSGFTTVLATEKNKPKVKLYIVYTKFK
ncbi:DUF4270 family protein [Sphingobacterium cellulitidis]|uniref:DUF4270 family protein n=1 Tax=Sphingobacterium cellulitidis TaxID=1768011 RepID=UPI003C7E31BB